jgi:hypothetical protein
VFAHPHHVLIFPSNDFATILHSHRPSLLAERVHVYYETAFPLFMCARWWMEWELL